MLALAQRCLERGLPCVWLQVVASEGESPGRAGFRMLVAPNGEMAGSIGGGIMEHKLVELARHQLRAGTLTPLLKRQIHRAEESTDRSGMICSGEQTVALVPLWPAMLPTIATLEVALATRASGYFTLTAAGPAVYLGAQLAEARRFESGAQWYYQERLDPRETVHLIGAGHVGLACSELLQRLEFRVCLYDDRPGLNTFLQNAFADEKIVGPYEALGTRLAGGPDQYAAIMTFGYRSDAVVVRQLLHKPLRYLGMMGSEAKIAKLLADLRADGFPEDQLARLHAPIGLPIGSRTPAEIAVSIAAELIQVRAMSL